MFDKTQAQMQILKHMIFFSLFLVISGNVINYWLLVDLYHSNIYWMGELYIKNARKLYINWSMYLLSIIW